MAQPTKCEECGGRMEEGFIPDSTYGAYLPSHWHRGPAEQSRIFGLPAGTKVDRRLMVPIRTFRCAGCGLLRSYAKR